MQKALLLAKKAYALDEVPIGAVVVTDEGKVIGRGYNRTEQGCSQREHAEVKAMAQAGKHRGDWRLDGCTVYVTLQPCLMCVSLMCLSRVNRLVYGADSPLFGYDCEGEMLPKQYKTHLKGITTGVLAQEAKMLLEQFFRSKRNKGE